EKGKGCGAGRRGDGGGTKGEGGGGRGGGGRLILVPVAYLSCLVSVCVRYLDEMVIPRGGWCSLSGVVVRAYEHQSHLPTAASPTVSLQESRMPEQQGRGGWGLAFLRSRSGEKKWRGRAAPRVPLLEDSRYYCTAATARVV
ncbi:unnamed protein product, partial [Ectocarpus fasciculatus]